MVAARFESIDMSVGQPYAEPAVDLIYDSLVSGARPEDYAKAVRPLLTGGTKFYGLIVPEEKLVAVGTLMLSPEIEDEVRVNELAVAEDYRGKGLGRLMMTELESVAVEEFGVHAISLYPDGGSRPFYEGLGYQDHRTEPLNLVKRLA